MHRSLPPLAGALLASFVTMAAPRATAEDAVGNSLRDAAPPPISDDFELLSSVAATAAGPPAESPAPPVPAPASPADSTESDDNAKPQKELEAPKLEVKADLDARLKALENAALTPDDKRKAVEYYQQALESFEVAAAQVELARKLRQEADNPEPPIAELTRRLATPLKPYDDLSGETLAKVEEVAANVETWLKGYRTELAALEAEPKRRSKRLAELPGQISDTQQKLQEATSELAALGAGDATDLLIAARRAALTQQIKSLEATLGALDCEQRLYQQGGEWLTLRHEYLARYVPYKEKRLIQLKADVNRRREAEAQQQAAAAAKAAEVARPQVTSELAKENKVLAERRAKITAELTLVEKQLASTQAQLAALTEQFNKARDQATVEDLSAVTGQLLRDQQSKLPNLRALRRGHALRDPQRSNIQLEIYDLSDRRTELANLDELTSGIAARAGTLSESARNEIRGLLEAKRDILTPLIRNCEDYSLKLNELHTAEKQLIAETESYADFIAERVLWIRSCGVLSQRDLRPAADALGWSLDPRNWRDAGVALVQAGSRQPALFTLFVLGFAVLAASQRAARRRLRELGEEADKRSCTKLRPTFHALWLTAVLSLPWPALLAFAGWSLDSLNESEFVRALSMSLRFSAVCLLLLELTRHLCRHGGLADTHFDWPDACLVHLRRKLRWLTMIGLPLVLWLVGLETQSHEPLWSSSLGRVCFMGVMLLLAAVQYRVLLAAGSPFRHLLLFRSGGWLTPLQIAWRPAVALLPVVLAVLAGVGYYFTAQQAALRVLETVAMLLAVVGLGGVTRRWLLVNRRRLAREQAKQRRAQLAAAAEADAAAPPQPELADESIDLAAISEQTQKLVRTFLAITTAVGLVLIWGEILPALAYPAGKLLPGAAQLTWGHLATSLFILGVTYISVRDIPALLELVVLQHLPLDSGARYAFTSISRYLLTAIGLTAAFNAVLMQWSDIQWLVAAMSVGLGFGLQEIFANFVSGVILLFERPIRVGDIVTLGDKSGVVNRIRMRATTIVDWDRKEYIVPNKDLVTGRLLNWTLTDQMNRIEIIILLAHGADTNLACSLLLDAAREQPHVLAEPAPNAAFEGLTEHGLKIALRCFLPTLEHRGSTIHELHTAIDHKFRTAGVEVASPPREMRLRMLRDEKRSHDEKAMIDARRIA
jgi:potassium efflux system protein